MRAPARSMIVQIGDSPGGEEHVAHPDGGVRHHNQGEPAAVSYLNLLNSLNLNFFSFFIVSMWIKI